MHHATKLWKLSAGFLTLWLGAGTGMAWAKEIPVYPGAKLLLEPVADEEATCCNFLAHDPIDKVLTFYEGALKSKPLDARGLAARYPDLKPQLEQLLAQKRASSQIGFFVLSEVVFQGKKGADLFEVVSSPAGVRFTVLEEQLAAKDAHFAEEWREKSAPASTKAPPRAADVSVLASALPAAAPPGFEKEDSSGDSGGRTSSAVVQYRKVVRMGTDREGEVTGEVHTVQVSITDQPGETELLREMMRPQRKGDRSIRVKGKYDGLESMEKRESGCEITRSFAVAGRYLVEVFLSAATCDMATLDRVIDSMNLDRLPVR